jgi:hypothetical protein
MGNWLIYSVPPGTYQDAEASQYRSRGGESSRYRIKSALLFRNTQDRLLEVRMNEVKRPSRHSYNRGAQPECGGSKRTGRRRKIDPELPRCERLDQKIIHRITFRPD